MKEEKNLNRISKKPSEKESSDLVKLSAKEAEEFAKKEAEEFAKKEAVKKKEAEEELYAIYGGD